MTNATKKIVDEALSPEIKTTNKKSDNIDSSSAQTLANNFSLFQSPTNEELSLIYTPETRSKALSLLLYFSILMVAIPFSSMCFCYKYIFNGYDEATNTLYSGVAAIAIVYILVFIFVYIAYNDEKIIEKQLKKKYE